MKLEKFDKNKKQKRIIVGSIIGIILMITGIIFYKSYAFYEEDQTYNVLKGTIPDFNYDVKLAVTIDGQEVDAIPDKPYATDGSGKEAYYSVKVDCGNKETEGQWDYNAWTLNLASIQDKSKCTLAFTTGGLTEAEYKSNLEAGVAFRRNTYRGKDITSYLEDGSLFDMIKDGTFKDIYVGDYIRSLSNQKDMLGHDVIWLVADLDNYLYTGGGGSAPTELTKHHATIIPAIPLVNERMNDTGTAESGYAGSKMVQTTLTEVYSKYIAPDFDRNDSNNVIEYDNYLTSSLRDGVSFSWKGERRKLDLMSEVNVYGIMINSSSVKDVGIDNQQYAIFRLKPEYIIVYGTDRINYWLKAVYDSSSFVCVRSQGYASSGVASYYYGVRPRFLIG